ncbi:MAG: hypothetical protein HFH37_12990 [Lachnospiraceae bacterium]|jgi:hypothetical protein|nr:hypothetical protein [Lachnospiraceae bacterium]
MKNNSKNDNNKIEIEPLLRKALRVKQEPSPELNGFIIKNCREYSAKKKF